MVNTGTETVPEPYILPIEDRLEASKVVSSDESIPVIDVSCWDDPMVQIINHGVPFEVLNNVRESAHRFYELPDEERKKYTVGNSPTDTVTLRTSFVPQVETVLEWKDYLSFRFVPGDDESSALWPPVCR